MAVMVVLTTPGLAEGMPQDVACSAFLAMNHDDMMAATLVAISSNVMAADGTAQTDGTLATDGTMATDGAISADDHLAAMVKACTAHPDMMVMDAMHMMN